jgi:glycolate oxidase iron-sulfur subunit
MPELHGEPPRPEGRTDLAPAILGDKAASLPGVLDCMHCGLCLEQCATYRLTGAEDQSPRGRLFLMRAVDEGRLTPAEALPSLSSCLQCRACEPVCPSKVDYHGVLGHYLARVPAAAAPRPARMVAWWLRSRRRLRVFAGVGRTLRRSGLAGALGRLRGLPGRQALRSIPREPRKSRWRPGSHVPAVGEERALVSLHLGCLEGAWMGAVIDDLVALLAHQGVTVRMPEQPSCCGAFAGHAGLPEEGRRMSQETLHALAAEDGLEAVLTTSAGCGAWLAEQDPQVGVMDALAFLHRLGLRDRPRPQPLVAALQAPCHQRNVLGGLDQTRTLLAQVPELVLVDDPEEELCCGAGGATFLREPEQARELGMRKLTGLMRERPDLILSANPGCRMQLDGAQEGREVPRPVLHPVQLLWQALRPDPPAAPR